MSDDVVFFLSLKVLRLSAGALLVSMLGACALAPHKPLVAQPMSVRPPARVAVPASPGSIYSGGMSEHPLFEDPRPRNIGDVLTVVVAENINATKTSGTNTSRTASADFTPKVTPGLLSGLIAHASAAVTGDNAFKATGGANAQNTFNGTITVTVTDVLSNGNLLVSGEKQMLINQGKEFIRFSGVVNPRTISGANTVASTTVADARIEYSASGYIDEAEHMGWLQRVYQNIAPF